MACCIKDYYEATGKKVGFKAAGGITTTADAVAYYTVIKEVLGEDWLTPDLFRIGASRLANNLLSRRQNFSDLWKPMTINIGS